MSAYRTRGRQPEDGSGIGADFKTAASQPGQWKIYGYMQGETILKETNTVLKSDKPISGGFHHSNECGLAMRMMKR